MSVNSYLQNLASDLVLSDDEKGHVTVSVSTIKGRLDNYFENDVTDKIVFGSYSRGTILPRSDDEDSDVDIMVVFDNPYSYKPQTFLNKLKGFAEHYYSTSEIYQSSPTIVLELNHIKFELTPAYVFYGLCYIPSGPSDWMTTDPDGFNKELIECNKNNGYKIKPIVRLLKHWNIWKNSRDMASFELEREVAGNLLYAHRYAFSYADYAEAGFDAIRHLADDAKVSAAKGHIDKAICLEDQGEDVRALDEIKKVFPEF